MGGIKIYPRAYFSLVEKDVNLKRSTSYDNSLATWY